MSSVSSAQSPPPTEDSPSPSNSSKSDSQSSSSPDSSSSAAYVCQWENCTKSLPDPEMLYTHLCNEHIGRKSTNNLCLTCKWNGCGTTCAKRDHITSHLRVHTPLKPHACEICKKTFKRPQDLKKHEKIHTEEHHAQHKHSKALTVPDPAFNNRVRTQAPQVNRPKVPHGQMSDKDVIGLLPTPSPEMIHPSAYAPHHHHARFADTYSSHPTWETIRPDGSSAPSTGVGIGMKRSHSHDYAVEDFFTDVKKRRLVPSYDSQMAARLSNLAYQSAAPSDMGNPNNSGQSAFNPRSISLNIRTPEELAALNQFLLTLGRDTEPRHADAGGANSSFFDMTLLNQLGLGNMPGIVNGDGGAGGAYDTGAPAGAFTSGSHGPAGYRDPFAQQPMRQHQHPHPHAPPAQPVPTHSQWPAGFYGGLHDQLASAARMPGPSAALGLGAFGGYAPAHMQPTPPLETGSPASTTSSPPTATPPHRMDPFDAAFEPNPHPHVRRHNHMPPAVLSAPDYGAKIARATIPLRTLPSASRAREVDTERARSRSPSPASAGSSTSSRSPEPRTPPTPPRTPGTSAALYPLLTSGDKDLKLPPLRVGAGAGAGAGALPGLRGLGAGTEKDLARGLGRLTLDRDEERARHALLIRDLLVFVNERFAREHGGVGVQQQPVAVAVV